MSAKAKPKAPKDYPKSGKPKSSKPSFVEAFAEKLIAQMEAGTSPFQQEWRYEGPGFLPMNHESGKRYRGINLLVLLAEGRSDPRWLTYRQAQEAGAQVRKGEHGTTVQYWMFDEKRDKIGDDGKPAIGKDGKPEKMTVKLDRPRVFHSTVFNAEQIDGMPPIAKPNYLGGKAEGMDAWAGNDKAEGMDAWADNKKVEALMALAGPDILHKHQGRAFYRPSTDEIHLPLKEQFSSAAGYYATALHEIGHSTGHPDRLARDLSGGFGSESYAREELRAETFSLMAGETYKVGYTTAENHAAYVKAWIKILQDDPAEIFRAAADAEKIMGYLAGLELKARQEAGEDARLFLTVPFADKDEAKRLGAQWDPDTLAWFVPEGVDPTPFVRWTGAGGLNGESEKGWTVREKPLPEENRSSEAKSLSEAKNPQPPGGEKDSSAPTSEPPAFLISIGWQEDGADPQSPMAFFFENRSTDAATLKEWLIANGCGIEPDNEIGGDREWGGVVFSERLAAEECPRYSLHLKSMDGHPLNLDAIEAFKAVLRDAMPPRSAPDTARIAAANEEDMEENIMAGARP